MKIGLTTHILDTAHGCPAAGVKIDLFFLEGEDFAERTYVKSVVTNEDGRLQNPLLDAEEMRVGIYELLFYAGDYFQNRQIQLPKPSFLQVIPVRIGIADPSAHYHVPLLLSPWGYQVYRGS